MHRKKNKRAGRKGLPTRIFRNAKNDRVAGREMSAMTEDRLKEDYLIPEPEDALGENLFGRYIDERRTFRGCIV